MMTSRLSSKPEIAEALIPSFAVGCRRLTPGPGYLEALVEDNVDFVTTKINAVDENGIILADGRRVDIDVLVCATGFNTSTAPPFGVIGQNGLTLRERWSPFSETYLTVMVDQFPNYFIMLGPNAAIGSGSLTIILEAQGDYIVSCIRKLQKEDYTSMVPKAARVHDFSQYVDEYFKKTVYMDGCNSWYRTQYTAKAENREGKGGAMKERITALWPGSTLHALVAFRAPRWEDFEFESASENKLGWLGNGWSVTQQGDGDPAWYLNSDIVDVPHAGKPEDGEKWKARPFSH